MEKNPAILEAEGLARGAEASVSIAGQRSNPRVEFALEGLGSKNSRQEISYVHPIELGGAKEARLSIARAEQRLADSDAERQRAQISLEVAHNLYRVRQIEEQLVQAQENIESFDVLAAKLQQFKGLNAEQKLSASAYRFALQEARLQQHRLLEERRQMQSYFAAIHGSDFQVKKTQLPRPVANWPEVELLPLQSPELEWSKAAIALAEGQLQAAESSAWGNLEIAPTLIQETQNGTTYNNVGVKVSIPLPLYQSNQAGKLKAKYQQDLTQDLAMQKEQELSILYRQYLADYEQMKRQWATLPSHLEVQQQHEELHSGMQRGVLPTALVIEIHRQLLALLEQRHALELDGVTHLIQLKGMQHKLLEFQLP
ncbi:MAG: hypothetical protein A2600_06350 [Candidatus Lambdaproteobacteria bacterium RIFOXYD1_FULL_56_27]|uniref:Transporter n=1 Tax=Candidatus Lambdaproteobacteria bacterium RIFOXYD2_FULL_56_26 TaxID=1817773 RepID=A0A1F6H0L6_9PROT|nr:MAG: hypothetical protein A2426_00950 [Candidatus Lambdaproteobacteria bacterium RIFOXYC1_FULL_56_13]OGH03830.1 MAG: hypothetical protein A2557_11860 [Candidatus Lambdaproteobacteria bacterium RIFOXYD2_FULL_56_26]OGH08958.1 MAG: hypothetical protein A2600_06350 [Candidatus Lambdaproteobacteria bacterium RIFOXYD1_FULL_56_27]